MWFNQWHRSWPNRPRFRSSRDTRPPRARFVPRLEALENRYLLAPVNYIVTNTNDSGAGSLRDAINQLNGGNPAYTTEIDFNISGSGVQTINLLSALPAISRLGVFINGLTEPGSSPGTPLIQLNGASAGAKVDGLFVLGANFVGEGLIISNFSNDGIYLATTAVGSEILSCFVGTNGSGTAVQGNSGNGIEVASTNNLIGNSGGYRNIVSGNGANGISLDSGATGNNVLGNYVGTNAAGTAALANGNIGLLVLSNNNLLGYTTGLGNVLSGNGAGLVVFNGASGNRVEGNFIGTNAAGTTTLANIGNGVEVDGTNNTIGSTVSSARNIISGNGNNGLQFDTTSSGNLAQGNYVGLNVNGAPLGNGANGVEIAGPQNTIGGTVSGAANNIFDNVLDGVLLDNDVSVTANLVQGNSIENNTLNGVEIGGNRNTIGGSTTAASNVISLNSHDGILIDSSGESNSILGNAVGTDVSGSTVKGNGGNGIEVAGSYNVLGSDNTSGAVFRNIVSANGQDGILIDHSASGINVVGNKVGTNAAGTSALGNSLNGIEVLGQHILVGFTSTLYRNLISGNANNGILLGSSASATTVEGNDIGTNASGTAALANNGNGIEILGSSNTIGGATITARNVISGNSQDGILLGGSGINNLVQSNFVGISAAGTAALANNGNGVEVAQDFDIIGGTVIAARNVISANALDGVVVDSGASGALVQDNFVGTNASGSAALGNSANGIEVSGTNNTIGGTTSGQRNLVSGNFFDGILLNSAATGNAVQGNFVGTVNAGTAALANSSNGVEVDGANNTIGGTTSAARNVISGNFSDGVLIASGASGVALQGNYIGTTNAGTAALANGTGVEVAANGATIGGTSVAARNLISGNTSDGVAIDTGVSGTIVQGNYIGTNVSSSTGLGNGGYGVNIAGSGTLVGGTVAGASNIIASNATGGVNISAGNGNTVRHNAITANGLHGGPGITLAAGANNDIVAPTLSMATLSGTTLTVTGTFTAPTANVPYVLEFFVSPAGDPEGQIYIGKLTVTPTTTGTQSFAFKASTSAATSTTLITATLTDNLGDTSAFSNGVTS
jgi:hypothetical protein